MKTMTTDEIINLLDANEDLNIIDVREDDEVEEGMIPGAVHIPLGEIADRAGELDKEKPYILVCRAGRRSGNACLILEEQGFVIGEQEERNNEEIESGNVIETNPQAGREREKGTTVDLIVSIGREMTKMENFIGKQREEVMDALEEFNDYDFKEEYSSEHPDKSTS